MPFNIELMTDDVAVKIQVVKKVITIYFNGEKELASQKRNNWEHLHQHFINDMPYVGPEEGIGLTSGVYHRKKEHTNVRESTIYHLHIPFLIEVTPEIMKCYLTKIFEQQVVHSKEYKFFQNIHEVKNVAETFFQYYQNYKGSTLEKEYEEETTLTPSEQEEHKKDIKKAQQNTRNNTNQTLFLLASLLSSQHPIFRPRVVEPVDEPNFIYEEENTNCNIM
ncbi:hypothetical protein [Legionella jamestowniensis]|uniref:Uncharacterized protein n=1 Tax=Legionella jamestowniensis TaxID=455 RepID=A0A0W0UNP3_9GAMM|nr:hypothetical protein [Legionella jamestowniensis]KTD09505.1 hypothetical protein Ljam_0855 [Legionella jamestowniensis]OCH98682.1 hypothetical protein A8135_10270 [Legionella jamestowniensis]SFL90423.1 hypothetical protein SAMN02746073_2526 [Legionella jamestowniensis DSM 19215]